MIFLPYRIDVPEDRLPVANWALVGSTCLAFVLLLAAGKPAGDQLVLRGFFGLGLFGHLFVHAGWLHLAGNMLFLFIFGNALCSKIGNAKFLFLYFASGFLAACAHLLIDGRPAVGASGAVSGVMAACAILFPRNEVTCLWFSMYGRHRGGQFEIEALWLILLWIVLDLFWAFLGAGHVAHWAHLGGYAGGFAAIAILIRFRKIEFLPGDRPLLGHEQVPLDGGLILAVKSKTTLPIELLPMPRLRERPLDPPPVKPLALTAEERKALLKPMRIVRRPYPPSKVEGFDQTKSVFIVQCSVFRGWRRFSWTKH